MINIKYSIHETPSVQLSYLNDTVDTRPIRNAYVFLAEVMEEVIFKSQWWKRGKREPETQVRSWRCSVYSVSDKREKKRGRPKRDVGWAHIKFKRATGVLSELTPDPKAITINQKGPTEGGDWGEGDVSYRANGNCKWKGNRGIEKEEEIWTNCVKILERKLEGILCKLKFCDDSVITIHPFRSSVYAELSNSVNPTYSITSHPTLTSSILSRIVVPTI